MAEVVQMGLGVFPKGEFYMVTFLPLEDYNSLYNGYATFHSLFPIISFCFLSFFLVGVV